LKHSTSFASLCGLSQFVTTKLRTDLAIWYCVNSGILNLPGDRDIFRIHVFNLKPMIKIIEALGYKNCDGLMLHYERTKVMVDFLTRYKKFSTQNKKRFHMLFKGFYQKGILLKGKISKAFSSI